MGKDGEAPIHELFIHHSTVHTEYWGTLFWYSSTSSVPGYAYDIRRITPLRILDTGVLYCVPGHGEVVL